jgi:hypothetical protein
MQIFDSCPVTLHFYFYLWHFRGIYPGLNLCRLHVTTQRTLCKARVDLLPSEQGKETVLIFREETPAV